MEMFKKGDKFIHFTKYGGVNKGEVAEVHEVTNWDTNNLCSYIVNRIFTTKGISLNLDGSDGRIYKIDSEMTQDSANKIVLNMRKLHDKKARGHLTSNKIHNIDEDKKA